MFAQLPPSQTAPIDEFRVLWTSQKKQKLKRWQDGFLRFHTYNKRIIVYDEVRTLVCDMYLQRANEVNEGDQLEFEHHLVTVEEHIGRAMQDLSAMITPIIERREQKQQQLQHLRSPHISNSRYLRRVYPEKQVQESPLAARHGMIPQQAPIRIPAVGGMAGLEHRSLNDILGLSERQQGGVQAPTKTPMRSRMSTHMPPQSRRSSTLTRVSTAALGATDNGMQDSHLPLSPSQQFQDTPQTASTVPQPYQRPPTFNPVTRSGMSNNIQSRLIQSLKDSPSADSLRVTQLASANAKAQSSSMTARGDSDSTRKITGNQSWLQKQHQSPPPKPPDPLLQLAFSSSFDTETQPTNSVITSKLPVSRHIHDQSRTPSPIEPPPDPQPTVESRSDGPPGKFNRLRKGPARFQRPTFTSPVQASTDHPTAMDSDVEMSDLPLVPPSPSRPAQLKKRQSEDLQPKVIRLVTTKRKKLMCRTIAAAVVVQNTNNCMPTSNLDDGEVTTAAKCRRDSDIAPVQVLEPDGVAQTRGIDDDESLGQTAEDGTELANIPESLQNGRPHVAEASALGMTRANAHVENIHGDTMDDTVSKSNGDMHEGTEPSTSASSPALSGPHVAIHLDKGPPPIHERVAKLVAVVEKCRGGKNKGKDKETVGDGPTNILAPSLGSRRGIPGGSLGAEGSISPIANDRKPPRPRNRKQGTTNPGDTVDPPKPEESAAALPPGPKTDSLGPWSVEAWDLFGYARPEPVA